MIHPIVDGDAMAADARLQEACGLAEALDLSVADARIVGLRRRHAHALFGAGRIAALAEEAAAAGVGVVIVDAALSPVQQRNLETALGAKVVDRTGLILEIFARRAATREGRLQVELARLGYERSRLVRTWTHLERQRGGLGKTGGPGETQIELDRRQIADRIAALRRELEDVRRTRALQRRARARAGLPAAVLVGYTNAGKSSLFNRMTKAGVLAKDMPFATLDPTARLVRAPSGRSLILSDTVGFITDLPTDLIAAFRATLEAVMEADVIVHVRCIASAQTESQAADVLAILDQLAQGRTEGPPPPILEVWNKIDLLEQPVRHARLARANAEGGAVGAFGPVLVSAQTGEGVDGLLAAIDAAAFGALHILELEVDPADGRARAWLAAHGRILEERLTDQMALYLRVELPAAAVENARRLTQAGVHRQAAE